MIIDKVPSHPDLKYLTFCRQVNEPLPIAISTWASVTVVRVTWRGIAYQKQHCSRVGWPPGIRSFVSSAEEPLSVIACRAAFWDMSMSTVQKVAKHIGFDVASDGTLGGGALQCVQVGDTDARLRCHAQLLSIPLGGDVRARPADHGGALRRRRGSFVFDAG